MSDIPAWLSVLSILVGIAAMLGGVVAVFRASYSRARIEALREDNQDLRHRIEDLERKGDRAEVREDELEAQVNSLSSENELLKELVLQRVEITGLGDLMTMHHKQSLESWEKIVNAISETKREVKKDGPR